MFSKDKDDEDLSSAGVTIQAVRLPWLARLVVPPPLNPQMNKCSVTALFWCHYSAGNIS